MQVHVLNNDRLQFCLSHVPDEAWRIATDFFQSGINEPLGATSPHDLVSKFVDACLDLYFYRYEHAIVSPRFADKVDKAAIETAAVGMNLHSVHRLLRAIYYAADRILAAWAEGSSNMPSSPLLPEQERIEAWESVVTHVQAFFGHSSHAENAGSSEPALPRLINMLVSSHGQDREVAEALRIELRASPHNKWVVAVGAGASFEDLLRETSRLRSLGYSSHCFLVGPSTVWIAQLQAGGARMPSDWLRTVKCGYLIADDLPEVPACIDLARILYSGLPADGNGPWSIRDGWLQLVLWEIADWQKYLLREVISDEGTVSNLPSSAELIKTALAYLRTGSVTDTAQLLFIHRNTVLYRLRQIKQVTAIDWTKPYDTALLLIILNALERSTVV